MNKVKMLGELESGAEGQRIYWKGERAGLKVQAKHGRFIICSRNRFGIANYSVIDLEEGVCGTLYETGRLNLLDPKECEILLLRVAADTNTQENQYSYRIPPYKKYKIEDVIDIDKTLIKAKLLTESFGGDTDGEN